MDKVSLPINTRPDIRIFMGEVAIFSILDFKDFAEDIFFSNPTLTADGVPYHSDQVNIEQQGVEINGTDNGFIISSKQHLEKKYANFYWITSHISEGTLEFTAQFKQRLDVFKQITVKMKNGYSIELYSDGQVRIYIDNKYFDDYFIESNLVDLAAKFRFEFCETRLRILYSVSKDFSKQKELCNVAADFSADDFSIWLTPACHPMYNILYNNYIQLAMPANAAGPNYCHGIGSHKIFNNVLSSFQINYEYLKNYPSCLDFLKENLKRGNYLSIPMDEYYVPNRNAYVFILQLKSERI